jgi:hypothetical protein
MKPRIAKRRTLSAPSQWLARFAAQACFYATALTCAVGTPSAFAQTDQECLQSFAVRADRGMAYIAVDTAGTYKVAEAMTCPDAELFRGRLFLSMNQKLFDSEQALRAGLADAERTLKDTETLLQESTDKAKMKSTILGAAATVNSTWAIVTVASCGSGLLNGAGLAACGPAIRASAASVAAWYMLSEYAGSVSDMKKTAVKLVAEQRRTMDQAKTALSGVQVASMKENRRSLFLAVCRAVKQQCM